MAALIIAGRGGEHENYSRTADAVAGLWRGDDLGQRVSCAASGEFCREGLSIQVRGEIGGGQAALSNARRAAEGRERNGAQRGVDPARNRRDWEAIPDAGLCGGAVW